jgi:hypothetical protein
MGFRWTNCAEGFNMPIKIFINGKEQWLKPTVEWASNPISVENPKLKIDPNFYVAEFNITE